MSHAQAVTLLADKDDLNEEAGKTYPGGKSALVLEGSSFPTTLSLQIQGPNGTWITVADDGGTTDFDENGVYYFKGLPAGSYRMLLTGGTATNLYAQLCVIP